MFLNYPALLKEPSLNTTTLATIYDEKTISEECIESISAMCFAHFVQTQLCKPYNSACPQKKSRLDNTITGAHAEPSKTKIVCG